MALTGNRVPKPFSFRTGILLKSGLNRCRFDLTIPDRVGQKDATYRPMPLEKNAGARRSGLLELQEAPPQRGVLVHTGPALPQALPAKRHPSARPSNGCEKLIGDEIHHD